MEKEIWYPQRSEIFDYIYSLYTNKMKDNTYTNKTQEKKESKTMRNINKEHDCKCKER